ncbi:MAG: LUD domain-containing protein [Algibacter sp.]|uniref:LUD domain-containing protein n=1 Tax=Algibacter sp. TaxID=1872428 RepID=UPI00260716C7|nr:LUD domain-containing protein [Algibacter sp.]MDG1731217.1 LUD domain-containing protein [Algibacter sp.]MDG1731230.1 LUD domain-containing protein [Algibacter sp.]MDG2178089.1 LUD domain-containing protein [Algibacter sp.]
MSLFRKIFGSKSERSGEELKSDNRGKYMPEIKLPIDERFTINFKANGGKFLYCENLNEIYKNLGHILDENDWEEEQVLLLDSDLKDKFKNSNLLTTRKISDATYFLTTCENLIANDGSLLISSKQIFEKKLTELPFNFIVFATTSQIVENIGEGLRGIKSKNKQRIPTNITTIKHFKSGDDKDFLSYGSSAKNLYLLLLEDL